MCVHDKMLETLDRAAETEVLIAFGTDWSTANKRLAEAKIIREFCEGVCNV